MVKQEAPDSYANYLNHGPFAYGPRAEAFIENKKAIFLEKTDSFGLY
jgi:hypothetical protein